MTKLYLTGKKLLLVVFAVLLSVIAFAQSCLTITGTQSDVTCYGSSNGSIIIGVTGGSGSYTYTWTGTGGLYSGQNRTNLTAGNYTLTVKDQQNGACQATQTFTITEPSPLNIEFINKTWHNGYGLSCANSTDGELTVFVNGGTAPYLYSINNGPYQTSEVFSNLPAGTYYTTVKDANGCLVTSDPNSPLPHSVDYINPLVTITGPNPLVTDPIIALPTGSIDSIVIFASQSVDLVAGNVTGGVAPYTYLWSPFTGMGDPTSNSITVAPTSTTTYTLTTTDANGCTITQTFKVVVNQISGGGGGGTGGGGSGGGSGGGGTGSTVNVCHNGRIITINTSALPGHVKHGDNIGFCPPYVNKSVLGAEDIDHPEVVVAANRIYPNPSTGKFAIRLTNVGSRLEIQVVNALGIVTEKRVISNVAEETIQQFDLTGKPSGIYFIKVSGASIKSEVYRVLIK
jgi:hypothetical protein